MTSALGFKAKADFLLAHFLARALFLRFTSGATPADYRSQHGSRLHSVQACSRGRMLGFKGRPPALQADTPSTWPPQLGMMGLQVHSLDLICSECSQNRTVSSTVTHVSVTNTP